MIDNDNSNIKRNSNNINMTHSLFNFKYRYKMRLKTQQQQQPSLLSNISCVIYLPIFMLIIFAIEGVRPIPQQDSTNSNRLVQQQKNQCSGRIFRPLGCEQNFSCSYQLAWLYNSTSDSIAFSVTLDSRDKWAAIGFAQERQLKNIDAIFGWTEGNTSYVMMDAHLPTWNEAIPDLIQSIANVRVKHVGKQGAEYKFTRRRNTQDPKSDILFSDENCPYFVFPYQGGQVDLKRRTVITSAEQLPEISLERICIRSCNYIAPPPLPPPSSVDNPPAENGSTSTTRAPSVLNQRPSRPKFKQPSTTTTTTTQSPSSTSTTSTTTTSTTTTTTTTTTTPEPTTTSTTTITTTQVPTTTPPPPQPTTTSSTTTTTSTTTTARPQSSTSTTTTTAPPAQPSTTSATTTTTTTKAPRSQQNPQLIAEESAPMGSEQQQLCVGRWSYPPNCRFQSSSDVASYLQQPIDSSLNIRPLPLELSDCAYFAQWQYLEASDSIDFIIQTKTRNRWTGIGFSNSTRMANSDAIIGLIEELSGRHFIMDTWLKDHVMPEIDKDQNTDHTSGKRENGTTTVRFRRKRLTDDQFDFQFTDTSCAYFFFPTQGGSFNAISKRLHKHEMVPFVSKQRICIKKCLALPQMVAPTSTSTSTTTLTSQQSTSTAQPNLFLLTSSSSNNSPILTQYNANTNTNTNQQLPPATSAGDAATPEKNLESQSNNHLAPSNDLSAELDSASVTSSVFASTSGSASGGTGQNGSSNLLASGAAATPKDGNNGSGIFSKLAFLAEPSLRWLAAIGCVATILAVIVFQACFTVYKNKQAYKQNLYRQSAFKQNNYLQGAYLPDTHNLGVAHPHHPHHMHHNGVQAEVTEEEEEEDEVEEVEPDEEEDAEEVDEDEEVDDEVDEEDLEEEEELDEDEDFDDYGRPRQHHPHHHPQHRHHLPRPTVAYPHQRGMVPNHHLPGYYPPHPQSAKQQHQQHHHHHNNAAYYPQANSKQHHHNNTASPHLNHHQMMHPNQVYHQQQRAQQQHYRSAGGHHHASAAMQQHQMHATGNLHHSTHRHHNVAHQQSHNLRSPDSYFLPSQRRYNKQ